MFQPVSPARRRVTHRNRHSRHSRHNRRIRRSRYRSFRADFGQGPFRHPRLSGVAANDPTRSGWQPPPTLRQWRWPSSSSPLTFPAGPRRPGCDPLISSHSGPPPSLGGHHDVTTVTGGQERWPSIDALLARSTDSPVCRLNAASIAHTQPVMQRRNPLIVRYIRDVLSARVANDWRVRFADRSQPEAPAERHARQHCNDC